MSDREEIQKLIQHSKDLAKTNASLLREVANNEEKIRSYLKARQRGSGKRVNGAGKKITTKKR